MGTGLCPRDRLKQFVEGAVSTGQGNISVGQFVHLGFTGVHIEWNLHAG
jgi:hypothetical protein